VDFGHRARSLVRVLRSSHKLVATVSDFLTVVFSSGRLTHPFGTGPASREKTTVRKSLTVATSLEYN
jgi:hypothetical protein